MLFIVALPHSLVVKKVETNKAGWYAHKEGGFRYWDGDSWTADGARQCPHCAEYIKVQARVCRHCGLEADATADQH
jgi:RNA polymerase subunit RPABC4/transcription elongation factor Spt4